ncbi:methionine-R-sulfoxide reductase-like protein [Polychytrium aggregatum]|uniref:methionine-R-sulfoxide reductase-like protein n=1 Tax=Polychytrium aggregatum TaxID=110093 RepID=UPI0022FE2B9C|nr:methionine-R-sulfoxide reductase-like protein [Polychytrium aggregatum]KAI9208814.1 methionine-R-sulfoxide reductase-like protein [Polychytrium aggregatum]
MSLHRCLGSIRRLGVCALKSGHRLAVASPPTLARICLRPSAVRFKSSSPKPNPMSIGKSESEWQAILTPEQFRILRQKGTEPPGTGKYNKHYAKEGAYCCAGCGAPLYEAKTKFDSGCGWPAFYEGIPGAINRTDDFSHGMVRTEITCAACGGHLGHVFKGERFGNPIDERHCVNSISITFKD